MNSVFYPLKRKKKTAEDAEAGQDMAPESSRSQHQEHIVSEQSTTHHDEDVNQSSTVQPEQQTSISKENHSKSTSKINISEDQLSTAGLNDLRAIQSKIPTTRNRPSEPGADFLKSSCTIIPLVIDTEKLNHCMILLHDRGQDETSLKNLSLRLQQRLKDCLFVLPNALETTQDGNTGLQGHIRNPPHRKDKFLPACKFVLVKIILEHLVKECDFRPQNIVILGHGEGAIVALRAITIWSETEFAGVIAVGSPVSLQKEISEHERARTPVLVVCEDPKDSGDSEEAYSDAMGFLKMTFPFVEVGKRLKKDAEPPTGLTDDASPGDESGTYPGLNIYMEFLAHRLRREEWKKHDVISFDGGGIRGYGSLLILEALMEKIASEETSRDPNVESSFYPCDFKPTIASTAEANDTNISKSLSSTGRSDSTKVKVNHFEEPLKNSAKFLPCHYFTYAAGTSTGGLISIMINRLRMPVNKCIEEYENLGEKVFGRPRMPIHNTFKPKFKHKYLQEAINEVCGKHGEVLDPHNLEELNYVSSLKTWQEDMLCQCDESMVLAILHLPTSRRLYSFRSYDTRPPPSKAFNNSARIAQKNKGYGEPSRLPVWKVARATSAAPRFFKPASFTNPEGVVHVFKDGGFGHNNPSQEMYADILHEHGEEGLGVFVSIGTGEIEVNFDAERNHIRDTLSNLKIALRLPTMTGPAHRLMEDNCKNRKKFFYARLDGGNDLGKIKMDEWKNYKLPQWKSGNQKSGGKTLDKIRNLVETYLQQDSVNSDLTELAKRLVERRRLRTRDSSEWDRFASFSHYSCSDISGDPCHGHLWRTANDFRKHVVETHHKTEESDIRKALEEGRRHGWIYRSQTEA